ncbi:MAG: hypothetical protein ACPG49_04860 [Chitinophagales bacterium]
MSKNKTQEILLNVFLYTVSFTTMVYMFGLLFSKYHGFESIGKMIPAVIVLLATFIAFGILDFRNKIFEAKTLWNDNLQSIFFLNLLLAIGLWAFTFMKIDSTVGYLQNGLWHLTFIQYDNWTDNHHYFHPILGSMGIIISFCTFCNVKYRLKRAKYYKTLIELLPIIVFFVLVAYHYNYIPKPYFNG